MFLSLSLHFFCRFTFVLRHFKSVSWKRYLRLMEMSQNSPGLTEATGMQSYGSETVLGELALPFLIAVCVPVLQIVL